MRLVNQKSLTEMKAEAVRRVEGEFGNAPAPVSSDKFNKEAAKADPRNDDVLAALLVAWTYAANAKVSTGTALINARSVVDDCERANRKAIEAAENAKEDVRNRIEKLGLQLPAAFHESGCECVDCAPFGVGK